MVAPLQEKKQIRKRLADVNLEQLRRWYNGYDFLGEDDDLTCGASSGGPEAGGPAANLAWALNCGYKVFL